MGLDNQGSQPLYKQLEEKIIQDIENGIYRKGQKIPTEKELSQMYDVSRITVRKALEEITKQGILERHAGLTESVMQMGYQFLWSRDDLQKTIFIFCRKI